MTTPPTVARRPYTARRQKPQYDAGSVYQELMNVQQAIPVARVRTVLVDDSVQATDDTIAVDATAGAITLTLPPADQLTYLRVTIYRQDATANNVIISGALSPAVALRFSGDSLTLQSNGTDWLILARPPVTIDATLFGAVGDGVTDNTAAFGRWAAAINAAGGGVGEVPPGTYNVTLTQAPHSDPTTATPMCAFTGLAGLILQWAGAVFNDTTVYAAGNEGLLFSWTNCQNIDLGSQTVTANNYSPWSPTQRGVVTNLFLQGCENIRGVITQIGGQAVVKAYREDTDPDSYRSKNFRLLINATTTEYPLLTRFSGDNVEAVINAVSCGRPYFPVGVSMHSIHVNAQNQTGAVNIAAFNGFGCSDIELWYRNTDTTTGVSDDPCILLQYSDVVAATHRNITIHLDVTTPALSPFFNTFVVNKVNSNPTGPGANGGRDVTGRGHVLDGLTIDGFSQQVGGVNHIDVYGYFVPSSDIVRNVRIEHLTMTSTGTSHARLGNLLSAAQGNGIPTFQSLYSTGGIFASESGTVTGATNATPIVLSFPHEIDLADGMVFTVSGVGGNAAANGTFYAKRNDATHIALYSNIALTTPVAGSGAYTAGGTFTVDGSAGARVLYAGCVAANFTDSTGDFALADYAACGITDGSTQSQGASTKNFLNTSIAGVTSWVKNTMPVGFQFANGVMVDTCVGVPTAAYPNGSIMCRSDGIGPNFYVRENGAWVSK